MKIKFSLSVLRYLVIQFIFLLGFDALVSALFWNMDTTSDLNSWQFEIWIARLPLTDYLKMGVFLAALFGIILIGVSRSKKIHSPELFGSIFIGMATTLIGYMFPILHLSGRDNFLLIPISHVLSWGIFLGASSLKLRSLAHRKN